MKKTLLVHKLNYRIVSRNSVGFKDEINPSNNTSTKHSLITLR